MAMLKSVIDSDGITSRWSGE